MKKIIIGVTAALSLIIMIFSGCDFRNNEQTEFESGDFIYTYINRVGANGKLGKGKYIAILELSDEGKEKETIIIPEEIDGKPVIQIGLTGFAWSSSIADGQPKFSRVYLSSTVLSVYDSLGYLFSLNPDKRLLTGDGFRWGENWMFVSQDVYEKYKEDDVYNVLRIADIQYFVDDKVYCIDSSPSEKILFRTSEPTEPPEPIKEGYKFSGWYKEVECKNKWDFGVDKFPTRQYASNDITIINLYAGWEKI